MNIIYKSENFEIPSNINDKKYYAKDGGGGSIYTLNGLILKVFKKKNDFYGEYNNYMNIYNLINDTIYQKFIIKFYAAIKYENEYIIFMDKNNHLINNNFLSNLDFKEQKDILFQVLFLIYVFNNKYLVYFNDLYYSSYIKNIMINDCYNNYNHKFKFKGNEIDININKYIINIIDFGYVQNYPALHTVMYMEKYFNKLFKMNIISEVLLYTLFFFMTLYPTFDKYKIVNNLNNIINIIFNSYEKEYIIKNFDALFINILYNSI